MRNEFILWGNRGLPRNGLVALYDPYRDAYGLDATARAALQTLTDYSGRGNHGTLGATTGASTDDPAFTGTSLSFDGGDYVTASSLAITVPLTYFACFTGVNDGGHIFGASASGGASLHLYTASEKTHLRFGTDGVSAMSASTTALDEAKCNIVVASLDADSTAIYWTNRVKVVKTGTLSPNQTRTTWLGGYYYTGGGKYQGAIHLAGRIDRVVSDSEAMRIYTYLKSLCAGRGLTVA